MKNPDTTHIEAARALGAACEQIELALQESQPSVDALAEALRRLASMLTTSDGAERQEALIAMRAEMMRAITCLQYHDRMTQHLTHVRDYLSESAGQLAVQEAPSGEQWNGLHRRLTSEAGRMYPSRAALAGHAAPGEVDLF
jgi:hypothetical protein